MPLHHKEAQVPAKFPDGFTCNKCHKYFPEDDWINNQEVMVWNKHAGYGSLWGDGNTFQVVLCDNCSCRVLGKYAEQIGEMNHD